MFATRVLSITAMCRGAKSSETARPVNAPYRDAEFSGTWFFVSAQIHRANVVARAGARHRRNRIDHVSRVDFDGAWHRLSRL
jgi:hypothetical protein